MRAYGLSDAASPVPLNVQRATAGIFFEKKALAAAVTPLNVTLDGDVLAQILEGTVTAGRRPFQADCGGARPSPEQQE